jgi:hypothetical protein
MRTRLCRPSFERMPRYVVERTFHETWDIGADGGERCRQIVELNGEEVTWLHSYVSEDGRKAFCMYEAPSPEAVRRSASRNDLPIDSITSVRVLDPYPYAAAEAAGRARPMRTNEASVKS